MQRVLRSISRHIAVGPTRFFWRAAVCTLVLAHFFCAGSALWSQTAHYVGLKTYLATTANYPLGVAMDAYGAVYYTDGGKIVALGGNSGCTSPRTVATGLNAPNGLGIASNGSVFAATLSGIVKITASSCTFGTPTVIDTQIGGPEGLAVDGNNNIYAADPDNHRIIKDTVSGNSYVHTNIITGLNTPGGIALLGTTLFVGDNATGTIQKYVASGNGYAAPATVATIPGGRASNLAVDTGGNLYVSTDNGPVYKETVSGSTYVNSLLVNGPTAVGLAIDSAGKTLYYGDDGNNKIIKYNLGTPPTFAQTQVNATAGSLTAVFEADTVGSGIGIFAGTQGTQNLEFASASNDYPQSDGSEVDVDVTFSPLFAGTRYGAVQLTSNATGAAIATVYLSAVGVAPQAAFYPGTQLQPFAQATVEPEGIAVDTAGNLYLADTYNNRVLKEHPTYGDYTATGVGSGLSYPNGVAIDGAGNLYIADTGNNRVLKETPAGTSYLQSVVYAVGNPRYLAVDGNGVVYIGAPGYGVYSATPTTAGGYTTAKINTSSQAPEGVAVDSNGNLYIADIQTHQIYIGKLYGGLYLENTLNVGVGNSGPYAIAVDGLGNIAVTDTNNQRVLEEIVTPQGYTEVVAGSNFSFPNAVVADQEGNLYVGDTLNYRVVKISTTGPQSLTFPNTVQGTRSAGQTITFANIGNANLNFPSYSSGNPILSTTYTGSFAYDNSTTCPTNLQSQSVYVGTICTFSIDFTPSAAGPVSGSLTLIDTSRNITYAVQGVELSGTGIIGSKTITFPQPTSPMPVNSSDSLMATTSSGDPVTYAITSGSATLTGSMITYTTAGSVTITASSAASSNYAAAQPVSVTVQVAGAQSVSWLPSTLSIYTGTALGTGVLDATDSVPATIAYTSRLTPGGATNTATPSTVLSMGKYLLSAIVTPTNTAYGAVTSSLPFTVQNMNPFVSNSNGTVSSVYNNGNAQSSSVSGGGVGAAVDSGGYVWSVVSAGNALAKYDDTGTLSTTYTNVGLAGAKALAIDGLGQVWAANSNGTVTTVSNGGLLLLTTSDPGFSGPTGVAIDMSGNVWISSASNNSVEEIIGGAAPVAPLANAVQDLTPGTRP